MGRPGLLGWSEAVGLVPVPEETMAASRGLSRGESGLPPPPGRGRPRGGPRPLPGPPAGAMAAAPPQQLRLLLPPLIRFLGLRTAPVLGGLNRMEERHPDDRSHWYLFILGAEQTAQGRGLGSALLAHMLARVDAHGMPAYLESSNERNLALYGRHG